MAKRAFILAIEKYDQMQEGLARTLPGSHDAALQFREWLIKDHGLDAKDILFCCEDGAIPGRTAGADRPAVIRELSRLHREGKDKTSELYFFYSGHGFCYQDMDGARLADVLLCADYVERDISGNACLNVDEVQKWLGMCMGPKEHFYFIDACRNALNEKEIKVGSLGLGYVNSRLGRPTVYTLYSTTEGQQAAVGSGFGAVLVEALKGTGRAKRWWNGKMAVLFFSVKEYVKRKLLDTQLVDERREGSGDGVIREISPTPELTSRILVVNGDPSDTVHAKVLTLEGGYAAAALAFHGTTASFTHVPHDYIAEATIGAARLELVDPAPLDLYESTTIRFRKRELPFREVAGVEPLLPTPQPVKISGPVDSQVVLRNIQTDAEVRGDETLHQPVLPGRYVLKILDGLGNVTSKQLIDVPLDGPLELDLTTLRSSPIRDALLSEIPGDHANGAVFFSETLGALSDQGLDMWLALIGASRIVGGPDDFYKLKSLPLAGFADVKEGDAPLYFLAGFDTPPEIISVALVDGEEIEAGQVAPHARIPGLYEWSRLNCRPGNKLLCVEIDNGVPLTVATCSLPNRTTLLTLTRDERGALRIQQFILPIEHLAGHLPFGNSFFYPYLGDTDPTLGKPLRAVKRMVQIQRQFAESKPLREILSTRELELLLYAKWFEPITSILAAYELTRRGATESIHIVIHNLRTYFAELPDAEALAHLAGREFEAPLNPPLVLEGLLALNMAGSLSIPPESLDFRGPWTAWKQIPEGVPLGDGTSSRGKIQEEAFA